MIRGTEYNNAEAIETLLFWAEDAALVESQKVAAVIMEPTLFEQPKEGYLQAVRDACSHYGTLLIFDEVVCGGRWAYGGGQEYFGVTPDLACFGKGLANGLPVGILCGKREYMRHAELVSGTFGGNGLSLAAVAAVLDVYEAEPVIETMWKRGKELQNHFDRNAKLWNIPAVCDGYPCKPRIRFLMHEDLNQQAMALFLQVCAEEGVLFHPGGFNVCAALTDDDMQQTRAAVVKGLTAIAISIKHNDWSALKGHLCQPVVTVRG
jgi:glutamate-1-semialdehyde aminotransferase